MSSDMQGSARGARRIVDDPNNGRFESWPISTDENTLWMLLKDVFEGHWEKIRFGPVVPGAAWEIRAPCKPVRTNLLDGYATIDFGAWHFHLCIGEFKGVAPELAAQRRTGRAEFFRTLNRNDQPKSWGIRLFTEAGHQQITIFLPNPFLEDNDRVAAVPDWSKLALWDMLRRDYLGVGPDPVDCTATRFGCG